MVLSSKSTFAEDHEYLLCGLQVQFTDQLHAYCRKNQMIDIGLSQVLGCEPANAKKLLDGAVDITLSQLTEIVMKIGLMPDLIFSLMSA